MVGICNTLHAVQEEVQVAAIVDLIHKTTRTLADQTTQRLWQRKTDHGDVVPDSESCRDMNMVPGTIVAPGDDASA